jgi:hypothetical protein
MRFQGQRLLRGVFYQGKPADTPRDLLLGRELVHKAFNDKDSVRRPDAAPESRRNAAGLDPHILDVLIGKSVDQVDRALGAVGIETMLERGRQVSRNK